MVDGLQKRSAAWRDYLTFATCALLYFYPFLRTLPQVTDEGTLIGGAERVTQGQIPYRDFFEVMGPGTFYWLAAFFRLWGVNWLATRIDVLVASLTTAVLLYFLSRRMKLQHPALPAVLFFGTAFGLLWPAVSHHADSNLFALLAFAAFVLWLEQRSWFLLLIAGLLAGVTTCFLQPKGALLLGAFSASVLILTRNERRVILSLAYLAAGYAVVLVTVIAYFWHRQALSDLVYANITFPMVHYNVANSLPYASGLFSFYGHRWATALSQSISPVVGYPLTALLLIPFLFVALIPALLAVFALWNHKQALSRQAIPYWLAGFALWISEFHRKDVMHLVYGSPLLIILCFSLYEKGTGARALHGLSLLRVFAATLALLNCFVVFTAQTRIETRRGSAYAYQKDELLQLLNTHIEPGEEIFAYSYRPLYYFLLNAPNATRYSFLMANYNTELQFREVLQELERKKISHVLWDTTNEDQGRGGLQQETLLEPYLRTHYTVIDSRQGVRLLERKAAFR